MKENDYLAQWIALKDENGLKGASHTLQNLFIVGSILSLFLAFLIFYEVHSVFIAIVSMVIGWSVAERNALRTRIKLWPQLEKYLNWDIIRQDLSK